MTTDAEIKSAVGRGMAIAATTIMIGWGDEIQAAQILSNAGYRSVEDLKRDEVSEYDINILKKLF